MRLDFHPLFSQDLEEAAVYYEAREPGQGVANRFLAEAERALSVIESAPLHGGFVYRPKNIRHDILRKFPYAVHYRVFSEHLILILGIYHGARDPKLWEQRL